MLAQDRRLRGGKEVSAHSDLKPGFQFSAGTSALQAEITA